MLRGNMIDNNNNNNNDNNNDNDDDDIPQLVPFRIADGGLGPDIHDPFGVFSEGVHAISYNMNPESHTQGRRVVRTNPPEIPTVEWVNEMVDLISCYLERDIAAENEVIDQTTRRWITNRIQILAHRINNQVNGDPAYVVAFYTALINRLIGIVA
jgi:hypothetical protein